VKDSANDTAERFCGRIAALLKSLHAGTENQVARYDVHSLLDAAFDLASVATKAEGREGDLANAAALTLVGLVAGWIVPENKQRIDWIDLAASDQVRWRFAVVDYLRIAPLLVPPQVLDQIMFALIALDDGSATAPLIFTPAPKAPGYGRNPASRQSFEQALIAWIEMEKAKGRSAMSIRQDVADAVMRSTKTIDMWLLEWRRREGRANVAIAMKAAADFGRGVRVKSPPSDEIVLLRLFPLSALAAGWRRGVAE
jgi:hypothetical protein